MSLAAIIVHKLLETGEADQDYDHDTFDSIVKQLAAAGFPGGRHREFDKYRGVYLDIPNVDKFWASWEGGGGLALVPEDDPRKVEPDEVTEIPIEVDWGTHKADITYLLDYIQQRYAAKFAWMKAAPDVEKFIDQSFQGQGVPVRPTRRGR